MNWRWLAFAATCVVLGLVLMSALAPDVGPAVSLAPIPPAPVRLASTQPPRPPPPPPTERDYPLTPVPAEDPWEQPSVTRNPEPPPAFDPDQEFSADLHGLAGAAVAHREGLVDCIESYQQQTGDRGFDGRFMIKITVSPGDQGAGGALSTEVINGPQDDGLDQCFDHVLSDSRFASPEHPTSVLWPIPLLGPADLPGDLPP